MSFFQPAKNRYDTNKTDVYLTDDIWLSDILDLKNCGPENNRGYRYVLVIIDNFYTNGWTVPPKNKNAQAVEDSFEPIPITSKKTQI